MDNILVITGLAIIGIASFWGLELCKKLTTKKSVLISCVLIAAALAARLLCMDHVTADYETFLSKWVDYFRSNGAWKGLGGSVGNYNVPYLYFLAFFSLSDVNDLYLIKLLSIAFDFILAHGIMSIVSLFKKEKNIQLGAYFVSLFLPTVILNSAYWGQ